MCAAEIEEVVRSVRDQGYAVMRGVVPKAPLDALARSLGDEYERAKAAGELFEGGGSVSGHLNCFPGEQTRFVHEAVQAHGILEAVHTLAPERTEPMRVTMNYNLPHSVAQHWHMDGLYTDAFLICNVAVVDTDLSNGAMDVIPGTNREFCKYWRHAVERRYRHSTRVEMEQGDALLRISTLWHRGMPNTTDVPRPLMSLTFGENGAPDGDPFSNHGGEVLFYPNWYSTGRLGRLRERAYVAAPWTYSCYRFARSLYGNKGYSTW
jgi:hypothetical protein